MVGLTDNQSLNSKKIVDILYRTSKITEKKTHLRPIPFNEALFKLKYFYIRCMLPFLY